MQQDSQYAWDGRQEYVKILGELVRVYLSCDYKDVIAWYESISDIVDFVSCRVDTDTEDEYITRLKEIMRLIHEKVDMTIKQQRKQEAYKEIRRLYRDCMRAIADTGLWGMVHKQVHPSEAVEDLF